MLVKIGNQVMPYGFFAIALGAAGINARDTAVQGLRKRSPRQTKKFFQETRNKQENEMSSVGYHEPTEELSRATRDLHRAIVSLMEELEAVDWYNQRADVCQDNELKAILEHNRDEEKEHASMLLEWIRRRDPALSGQLKDYLFTEKPLAHQ